MFDQRNTYERSKEDDNYPPYCCPGHQLPLTSKVCAGKYATPLYYTSIWKEQSELPPYITKELQQPLPVLEAKPTSTGVGYTHISPELQQLFREQYLQQQQGYLSRDSKTPQGTSFQYDQKFFKQPLGFKAPTFVSDGSRKSVGSKLYMRHIGEILRNLRDYGTLTEAQTKFLEKDLRYLANLPLEDKAQIIERLKAQGLLTDQVKNLINDMLGPMAESILSSISQAPYQEPVAEHVGFAAQPYSTTGMEQPGGGLIDQAYVPSAYLDQTYPPGITTGGYLDQSYAQQPSDYIDQPQLPGKRVDPYQKDVYSSLAYKLAKQPGGYDYEMSVKSGGLDKIYDKTKEALRQKEQIYGAAKKRTFDISQALQPFIKSSAYMKQLYDPDKRPDQSISETYIPEKRIDHSISLAHISDKRPDHPIGQVYRPDSRRDYTYSQAYRRDYAYSQAYRLDKKPDYSSSQAYRTDELRRRSFAQDIAKKKITFQDQADMEPRFSGRLTFISTQKKPDLPEKYTTNIRVSIERMQTKQADKKKHKKDELGKLEQIASKDYSISEKSLNAKLSQKTKEDAVDKELKSYFNTNNIFRKKGLAMDPYETEKLRSVLSKSSKDIAQSNEDSKYLKGFLENLGRMKPHERTKYMNKLQKNKVLNLKALETLQKYATEGDADLKKEDVAQIMNNIEDVTKANIQDIAVLNDKYVESAIEHLAKGDNANMEMFLTQVAKLSGDQRKSYFSMSNLRKLVTPDALQLIRSYMDSNKTKLRPEDIEKLHNLFRKSNFYISDDSDDDMERFIEKTEDLKHLIKTLRNENNTLSDDEKLETIQDLIKKIFQLVPKRITEFINSSYVQEHLNKATLKQMADYTKKHMNEFNASLSQVEELINVLTEASTDPTEVYGDVNALRANSLESVLQTLPERLARKYLEGLETNDLARDEEQTKLLHKLAFMDIAKIKPFLRQIMAKGLLPHEAIPDILAKLLKYPRIEADKAYEIESFLNEYKMRAMRKSVARASLMPRRPTHLTLRRRSEAPYRHGALDEKRKSTLFTLPSKHAVKEILLRPRVTPEPTTTSKFTSELNETDLTEHVMKRPKRGRLESKAKAKAKTKAKPETVTEREIEIDKRSLKHGITPISSYMLSDLPSIQPSMTKVVEEPKLPELLDVTDDDEEVEDETKEEDKQVEQKKQSYSKIIPLSSAFEEHIDERKKDLVAYPEKEKKLLKKEVSYTKLKKIEHKAKELPEEIESSFNLEEYTEGSSRSLVSSEKEKKKLKKEESHTKLKKSDHKEHRKEKLHHESELDFLKLVTSTTEPPKVQVLKDPNLKPIIRRKHDKTASGSISGQSRGMLQREEAEEAHGAAVASSEKSTSSEETIKGYKQPYNGSRLVAESFYNHIHSLGRTPIGVDFRANLDRYHPPPALIDLNTLLWKMASLETLEMTESFIRNLWRKGEITARKLNDLYRLIEKNPEIKPDKKYALLDTMKALMAKKIFVGNLPKLRISYYPPIMVRGHPGIRLLRPQPLRHPNITINYVRGLCSYIPYLRRNIIEFAKPEEKPKQSVIPSSTSATSKRKQSTKKR